MAVTFKPISHADRTHSRTLLHENIPITGALVSGSTYTNIAITAENGVSARADNIKTFSHGMFQSVYDYPYASSSANHLFDVTLGCSTRPESLSSSTAWATTAQRSKKVNIYNQMAQVLAGYNTGSLVRTFDLSGSFEAPAAGENYREINEAVFLNFSRLLTKDEIKKGSFSMTVVTSSVYANIEQKAHLESKTITDVSASNSYKVNSPAGEYGVLTNGTHPVGLLYYQAGIAVLTASVFEGATTATQLAGLTPGGIKTTALITGSTINSFADAARKRIFNISFNNTTELNSTIYFCRAHHHEFNYSSNPTYLSGSKKRVKEGSDNSNEMLNPPRSYVTTVGLYSPNNELLAVAKLSEPLRKDPTVELNLRVRLDY